MHPTLGYRVRADIASPPATIIRRTRTVIVGYARVSTQDQDLSAQLDALRAASAATIYREKISGARDDRPQLTKLLASLRKGDVVLITKIDRLARSTRELLNLIAAIDERGASLKSLGDPLFNTSNAQGRLLVAVLGAVAEFERKLIRETHRCWPQACNGRRNQIRPQIEIDGSPAAGSSSPTWQWRDVGADRPFLRGQHQHDLTAIAMKTKLLAVLVALAVATWWCWKPSPPSKHLPRTPLSLYSEIG
jgi:Resolvase, N terminal domain